MVLEISYNEAMSKGKPIKPIKFNDAAKRALLDLPADIVRDFGHHLFEVQKGLTPSIAKVLKGFGGADVLELRETDVGGTYRAVYTVRFEERIYVLHAFQKKSHKGIATDKHDIELIKARLKWAEAEHATWLASRREE